MATPKTAFDSIAKFIGQYDKKLIAQALMGLEFVPHVRTISNASLNGTLMPKMTVTAGIRNLNLNVETRSGNHRNWSGRKLMVYPGMKIIDMVPEELYNTFQSDMITPGAKVIPFAQWVWEQEFKKIAAEINAAIYFSDYKGDATALDTAVGYSVGNYVTFGSEEDIYKCVTTATAGQTPTTHPAKWVKKNESIISTGWGTIIANEINSGALTNVISTGLFNATDALDQAEEMVSSMTIPHQNLGGTLLLDPTSYNHYLNAERTKYGPVATPAMGTAKKFIYGKPQWTIEMAPWLGNSRRVIATQKDNLVFGTNVLSDMSKAGKTIETLHGTRTVVKWIQGCEISDLETLYVNDQA